jgi:hypothetical protein
MHHFVQYHNPERMGGAYRRSGEDFYDPGGSYTEKHQCGSGQASGDLDADSSKFRKFHQDNGSTVKFFVFKTTP